MKVKTRNAEVDANTQRRPARRAPRHWPQQPTYRVFSEDRAGQSRAFTVDLHVMTTSDFNNNIETLDSENTASPFRKGKNTATHESLRSNRLESCCY